MQDRYVVLGSALLAMAGLVASTASHGQSGLHAYATPQSSPESDAMAVLWETPATVPSGASAPLAMTGFSIDGRSPAVRTPVGIRLWDAPSGQALRWLPPDSVRQASYSIAVAANGSIAIGRVGGIEFHDISALHPRRYACVDACGPVLAVAFSPDGARVAYQGSRGLLGLRAWDTSN